MLWMRTIKAATTVSLAFSALALGTLAALALLPSSVDAHVHRQNGNDGSILSVATGDRLALSTPMSYSGGQWTADYGTVDGSGKYTAPPYVPGTRADVLRYITPSGTVTTVVHIAKANNGTPVATKVPFDVRPAYASNSTDPDYVDSLNAAIENQPKPYYLAPLAEAESGLEVEACVEAADTLQGTNLVGYDDNKVAVAITAALSTATTTSERSGSGTQHRDVGYPPRPPQRCRPKPGHQPPPGYCTGPGFTQGKITIDPPVYGTENGGNISITVTAENKWELSQAFPSLTLTIGVTYSLPLTYYTETFSQHQIIDVWKCVNGTWVFDHSEMCRQSRIVRTKPGWAPVPAPPSTPWQPSFPPQCCGRMG